MPNGEADIEYINTDSDSPVFEYDVKIVTLDGTQFVGVGNGSGSSYNDNMPYSVHFSEDDISWLIFIHQNWILYRISIDWIEIE